MRTAEGAERSLAGAGGCRKLIHIDMDAFHASVEQDIIAICGAKPARLSARIVVAGMHPKSGARAAARP